MNTQAPEKRHRSLSLYEVHSIFKTIQGEGPFTGYPAVFVRLAGCNLQCPGCDTEYTRTRQTMSAADIANAVKGLAWHGYIVVISGGEPFRQDIESLVRLLISHGRTVQIETNGTLPPHNPASFARLTSPEDGSTPKCFVVCSPKTGRVHSALYPLIHCYKYVMDASSVASSDGLPLYALGHPATPHLARPHDGFAGKVYLQPRDEDDVVLNRDNLESCIKSCMEFGHVLQLQVHKIIGVA
jgi:7-carboxy-7-deazaguanine synthase